MVFQIFKKELSQYFNSASGIIAVVGFIVLSWLFCWVFPGSSFLNYGFAEMSGFFQVAPYLLMFLIPALSMKLWADEYQFGTIELLLTKPVAIWQYGSAKFFAGLALVLLALLASTVFFYSLYQMASPVGNIDVAGTLGSYIGLLLLAMVFMAIGLFCSALSASQVTAFILAFGLCFVFYELFAQLALVQAIPNVIKVFFEKLSLSSHYQAMGRGVIGLGDSLYFVGLTLIFMYLSHQIVASRKV